MKILYLADINSPLIINLTKKIKEQNPDWEIDILSNNEPKYKINKSVFSNIYTINQSHFFSKIPFVKMFWISFLLNKEINKINKSYNCIHMLFVHVSYWCLVNKLNNKCTKFIITVFGSDFYQSPKVIKTLIKRIVDKADYITATNPKTLSDFINYYQPSVSTKILRFGLSALENIKNKGNTPKNELKINFGLPTDKKIITCGYNGSKNQNHLEIIEQLNTVKDILPPFFLIFPITTGIDPNYFELIELNLKKYKFDYLFLKDFLTDDGIAELRLATDLMIQVQSTDQLSGSMQEHLFAGNIVITGNWLPYEVFDKAGIKYYKVDNLNRISDAIQIAVNSNTDDLENNKKIIWNLSSWETSINDWITLYKPIANQ